MGGEGTRNRQDNEVPDLHTKKKNILKNAIETDDKMAA
jgi:hypothetical protein